MTRCGDQTLGAFTSNSFDTIPAVGEFCDLIDDHSNLFNRHGPGPVGPTAWNKHELHVRFFIA
jgi:hypothetical protein